MLEQAMSEFGRRLGLSEMALSADKPLSLELAGLGVLSLELEAQKKTEVIMSLAAPLAPYDQSTMRRSLEMCHFNHNRPYSLATGCQADHVLLMVRLSADRCQGSDLERAAEMLIGEMRSLLIGDGR
ncbi:MAG: CesT family type III secretion system chaperone [Deltaproteobacteria bacterium]|jgi:type III secretion system chaperone SycN|nr:CesT family type III secretion system chaperone [Deltaproteobacteria bacterium]